MKKTKPKTNKQFLRQMSHDQLQPLIDHCRDHGAKADVCRRLNLLLPEPVAKIQISNWLGEDEAKRAIPTAPVAALLMRVWEQIKSNVRVSESGGDKPTT